MKIFKSTIVIILLISICSTGIAQSTAKAAGQTKTETLKVLGKCDICKSRIEKAVKTEGVTKAKWVSSTQLLTITFDPSKTSSDLIAKRIAAAGHDNEKFKASDEAYASLPGCCHYERGK